MQKGRRGGKKEEMEIGAGGKIKARILLAIRAYMEGGQGGHVPPEIPMMKKLFMGFWLTHYCNGF